MGFARVDIPGADLGCVRTGSLSSPSEPPKVPALVKEDEAEMGCYSAHEDMGEIVAEADDGMQNARLSLP